MRKIKDLLCALGFHSWIHIGEGENVFTKRYCTNCRRQEKWSNARYYRIENISYNEMKGNY